MRGRCRSRLHRHRQHQALQKILQDHPDRQRPPVAGTAGWDSQEGMTMPIMSQRLCTTLPALSTETEKITQFRLSLFPGPCFPKPAVRLGCPVLDFWTSQFRSLPQLGHSSIARHQPEERRVGKEWRYRWSPYHGKKIV